MKQRLAFFFILTGIVIFTINMIDFSKGFFSAKVIDKSAYEKKEGHSAINVSQNVIYERTPRNGEEFGELIFPSLQLAYPIYEGTDENTLTKGVGHYRSSVLPGEANNSILSGHRDTVFRRLGELKRNDKIVVTTSAGAFLYKVKKTRIVEADDNTVMVQKPTGTLTITTCYPFYYIGDAPQRFIVVADLISKIKEKG